MRKWIYFGKKRKNYNMKKILYLISLSTLLFACTDDKSISKEMHGHWMQKDFYEAIVSKKNIAEITAPMMEFIIPANDSNATIITYGKKSVTAELVPYKKNHVVIKNYFGNNINADVKLVENELHFINGYTQEKIAYVKITDEVYKPSNYNENLSKSIPFVHHQYISGTYSLDSIEVKFVDEGKVKGLDKFENFSLCYEPSCRNGKNNTLFLSDINYEGNYYEYEIKGDSLLIYDIDTYAIARGMKSGKLGVKYALKKIN